MDFCVNECDRLEIDYLMSTRTCVILFYQYAHTPSQLSQPPCYSSQLHQVCWVILKMCSVKTRKKIQLLFLAFDKYQQFSFIWSICITSIFPCIIYFPKQKFPTQTSPWYVEQFCLSIQFTLEIFAVDGEFHLSIRLQICKHADPFDVKIETGHPGTNKKLIHSWGHPVTFYHCTFSLNYI